DPVFSSPVQIDDIPLRHHVHNAQIGLKLHNASLHIMYGREANHWSLVSRKHELHNRVARRDSGIGQYDLNSGEGLVNFMYLNHREPIDQMPHVLTGHGMEYFMRTFID